MSHAGEKIIDLPEDTPYSFLMIDVGFPFIRFPSLLAPLRGSKIRPDLCAYVCYGPFTKV